MCFLVGKLVSTYVVFGVWLYKVVGHFHASRFLNKTLKPKPPKPPKLPKLP